jgi:2-polyprenyl-3-methyl-5-hydroxy-6-metoxy-1,4-benzoquinol methylase
MGAPPTEPAGGSGSDSVEVLSPPEPQAFPEEWYDLSHPDHFWFEWRLRAFLRLARENGLDVDRALRLLDVGAGGGVLRDQLESCSAWTVDIADLNSAGLARARKGRGRILCYDVAKPRAELEGGYDAALLFDVIEHLDDPRPLLRGALAHLRPGGRLFVNVPAGAWLFSAYDVAAGHVRRYGTLGLRRVVEEAGGRVLDVRAWGLSLVPLLVARKVFVRKAPTHDACVRRGFEPPGRLTHALLRALGRVETAWLERPPFGTSLLLAAQKRTA